MCSSLYELEHDERDSQAVSEADSEGFDDDMADQSFVLEIEKEGNGHEEQEEVVMDVVEAAIRRSNQWNGDAAQLQTIDQTR